MRNFYILEEKILNFLSTYLQNSKAKGFSIGLSGGLDSAVTATLCAKVAYTRALIMPTKYSNPQNIKDALNFCEKLTLPYEVKNIDQIINSFIEIVGDTSKIRLGNLSARIRMCLLYDDSAKYQTLVAGTSNKSERMLGYGTIYGDIACALNPIGEIYKSDLFDFARHLKIDEAIISKAPSADLWEGQTDEGEIGFNYTQIDAVLKKIQDGLSPEALKNSFDEKLVNLLIDRIQKNKFKLSLPPIANIT